MRQAVRMARGGIAVLAAALAAGCASAPAPEATRPPAAAPAPDPDALRMAAASEAFALGRDAALAGDFTCARLYFDRAIGALRPETGPAPAGALFDFSNELYEGIQRYEALAGATEEAGTSHGDVSPELAAEIEAPQATPEEIATAREAVATEIPAVVSDVPIVINDAVLRVIAAFQSDALRDKINAGFARSGRYVPMIHRVFAEEGLPRDLAMIALIESAFLPHARSPRAAHGIWQFMPRTGRHYGLKSNGVVDERSDPEKATRAAARYLGYLHELFNDWYLAMAAYNAGEGKIMRAMQRTGARDFWELAATSAIRNQTKNYVPAFLASVLISKNPAHYGFDYEPAPAIEYETIRLDRSVDLRHLSNGAGIPLDDLTALNPELRSLVTPLQPEGYELRIPTGTRETARLAFASAPTVKPPAFKTYVARKGDSLPRIARRYGVTVASIAAANSLSSRSKLSRGQEVLVPVKVASARPARAAAARKAKAAKTQVARASAPQKPAPKSYRVKNGDTVYRIALRHGVSVAEILAINGLPGGGVIKPGDRLRIPDSGK